MPRKTILFVDNEPITMQVWVDKLKGDGYQVVTSDKYDDALHKLKNSRFSLAVLDLRMRDDRKKDDFSGLDLAEAADPLLPKIILTGHPTFDALAEAIKPRLDRLPLAVEFVLKDDGYERLREAIDNALADGSQPQQMQVPLQSINKVLLEDHQEARTFARVTSIIALIMAPLGAVIAFVALFLAAYNHQYAWVGVITGAVIEVMSYLFFKRVDAATVRADQYHREWVQNQHFDILLRACEGITVKEARERSRCQVLTRARQVWLADSPLRSGDGISLHNEPAMEREAR